MWKYITKKDTLDFLLSLHFLDEEDPKKHLQKLYAISNNIEKNYHTYKIKKRRGGFRIINAPNRTLKHIQRKILRNILNNKAISSYAKGYHQNISLKDNALPHLKNKVILKLDILDFFNNITFKDVYVSCFPIEYFPKPIGQLLTYLCTFNDSLPQGAPTSPYISNLVLKNFDNIIGKYAEEHKINYTRYSDDLTFSGSNISYNEIINLVKKNLAKYNLELNMEKIHIIKDNRPQIVTGVVVNEIGQVNKKYRDKIRQEMYYIKKYGLKSHLKHLNITDKEYYLKNLKGRINFVLNINNLDKEFINYKNYLNKKGINNL